MHFSFELSALVIIAGTLIFYGGANWQLLRELVRRQDAIEKDVAALNRDVTAMKAREA